MEHEKVLNKSYEPVLLSPFIGVCEREGLPSTVFPTSAAGLLSLFYQWGVNGSHAARSNIKTLIKYIYKIVFARVLRVNKGIQTPLTTAKDFPMRIFLLSLVTILSLTACREGEAQDSSIIKVNLKEGIYNKVLFIPKADFNKLTPYVENNNSVLLSVVYPDMKPILEEKLTLNESAERYKNISILIDQAPKPTSIRALAENKKKVLKTVNFFGVEYGLLHYTQHQDGIKDYRDVWIDQENNEILSVITCSEKILETDRPQCNHFIRPMSFSLNIAYDKRLLKDWQSIKKKVLNLLGSYQEIGSSKNYYLKRINE